SEFNERFLNITVTVGSESEAAETMQPRRCALDDPAVDPQTTAVFRVAAWDHRDDAQLPQVAPQAVRIISPVRVHLFRTLTRVSHLARYRRNFIDHVRRFRDV